MNLDYVATDEYGNIVPTDDPTRVFQHAQELDSGFLLMIPLMMLLQEKDVKY